MAKTKKKKIVLDLSKSSYDEIKVFLKLLNNTIKTVSKNKKIKVKWRVNHHV